MPALSGSETARLYAQCGVARCGATRIGAHSPETFVSVNGVQYAAGRASTSTTVLLGSLSISDILDATPNTCSFRVIGFVPVVGQAVVVTLGSRNNVDRLFAGQIITVSQGYVVQGLFDVAYDVRAVDYTWLLNRRRVLKRYTNQSASSIAADIIATFASGFTSTNVAESLATVDEISFTNQEVTDALSQLAQRIGASWYVDYNRDVHFFITDTFRTNPTTLTITHPTLKDFQAISDITQFITRVYVEGYGTTAATAVAVGDATIAVADVSSFSSGGGTVVSGPQRITYTGILSGSTTVPGSSTTMAARPVPGTPVLTALNGVGGAPDTTGSWQVQVTYRYSDGIESMPSASSNADTITNPSNAGLSTTLSLGDANVLRRLIYTLSPASPLTFNGDALQTAVETPGVYTQNDNVTTSIGISAQQHGSTRHPPSSASGYVAGATYIYVSDCAAFNAAGGSAQSGSQVFTYTGRSVSSGVGALTGVSGIASTIALGAAITAIIPAGSTSLPVADTTSFSASGGTARVGSQTFTYTGRSAASGPGNLTGIPASGVGSLASAVAGGSTVLVGAGGNGTLSGVPSSGAGSVVYAINLGDDVNILAQVDDAAAQTALAALIGGDGIQEEYIQDRSISYTEALERGNARLSERNQIDVSLQYACRDKNSAAGRTVTSSMASPMSVSGDFKIQQVTIGDFQQNVFPTYQVDAAPTRFSFEDLIRQPQRG